MATRNMNSETSQKRRSQSGAFIPTLIVLAVLVVALVIGANIFTEVSWYSQLKASRVFWTQWGWTAALGALGIILVSGSMLVNFVIARRSLGAGSDGSRRSGKRRGAKSARSGSSASGAAAGESASEAASADSDGASDGKKSDEAGTSSHENPQDRHTSHDHTGDSGDHKDRHGKFGARDSFAALMNGLMPSGFGSSVKMPKSKRSATAASSVSKAAQYRWLVVGLALIIGIFFGAQLGGEWRTYLTWAYRTPFGTTDPQFHKDISFYVFTLPMLHSLLRLFVLMLIVGALGALIAHYLYGGFTAKSGQRVAMPTRLHLGILGGVAALLLGARFWLSRYDMLLNDNSKFAGASYSDVNASLPGRTILAIACVLLAVLVVFAAVKGTTKLVVAALIAGLVTSLVVSWGYPAIIQQFKVTPNAVELESPYIQRNIDATLKAYGLDKVESTNYTAKTTAEAGQLRQDAEATAQIRLLDPNILSPTFNQLQQNKQYYQFSNQLSVDSYKIDGVDRDTVIAVRELNLDGLDQSQRTWVNDHTVYTHGYGVAAAYGNTTSDRGAPQFFQSGIPSVGQLGDYEPRVYFGQNSPDYSIVGGAPQGSSGWEIDYPDDKNKGQVNTNYAGNGGPKISNALDKLLYAIRFGSTDMFFSDRVTSNSQILFNRDPQDRVAKVAPYLTLDSRVFPAIVDTDGNPKTPKRLVWMIDGYTTSNNYPYSARESLQAATADSLSPQMEMYGQAPQQVNYIRNSVKATVDAYDGSVTLYAWDVNDPILKAWNKIFPNMLKPISDISSDQMAHVRYPEDLFKVQRTLLAKYHVTDAASFYSGGDFWKVPNEPAAGADTGQLQPPFYLTLQMPGQESAEFSLSTSFVPGGTTQRNVMTGFLAVNSNAGSEAGKVAQDYGTLRLIELPRDQTVPGPGQAQNNFVTDSAVSTQLNLLRQGGTNVRMGNLLSLPVGGGLLYVQPVYVEASSGTTYPLMQYVLTSFGDGNPIGFAQTLQESLNKTFGGNAGAAAGDVANQGKRTDSGAGAAASSQAGSVGDSQSGQNSQPDAQASPQASAAQPPAGGAGSEQKLNSALEDASKAMKDSDNAMKAGDWTAYGEAQKRLQSALESAVSAEQQLSKAAEGNAAAASSSASSGSGGK
ncbi:MAG: UPF0182 family protein [Actinomycetaceae bacterium]|nr:UPF0182 family protein [Actinomycetaceae bacterium]MDY6083402.1 UPF0182 family protein [Actinomycetaceae bacterium]